jgi:acyl carrier protein
MGRQIPQGVEVLVNKAAVDPAFRAILLERRAAAAEEIGLDLSATEAAMLAAVPAEQLQSIIAQTTVPAEHRRAFLGKAAAAMLAAVGAMTGGVAAGFQLQGIRPEGPPPPTGIRPDRPITRGIQPDRPPPKPTIEQRIVEIIAAQFKVEKEKINRDTSFIKDLKADMAQRSALRKELEKQFDIKIPVKAFDKVRTVGETIDYVETAVKNKKAPPEKVPLDRVPVGGIRPGGPAGTFGVRPD